MNSSTDLRHTGRDHGDPPRPVDVDSEALVEGLDRAVADAQADREVDVDVRIGEVVDRQLEPQCHVDPVGIDLDAGIGALAQLGLCRVQLGDGAPDL
jgi:hypothetical protein